MREYDYRRYCLKRYGKNSISFLTLSRDLSIFSKEWEGYIPYHKSLNTIIVPSDPIVSKESLRIAIRDLKDYFSSKNIHICLFACTGRITDVLEEEGFEGIYLGKEAIVELKKFSISGNKKWNIRSSINYAKKNGMVVEEYNISSGRSPYIEEELKKISDDWCRMKKIPKPTFIEGELDFKNEEIRYFTCKYGDKIVGYANYYPIMGTNNYYLDHTRRIINSPRGVIDYILVESFKKLEMEGVDKIYIGLVPFSFYSSKYRFGSIRSNILFVFSKRLLEFFYPTKSEYFFKKKYATDWESNYFYCYPKFSMKIFLSLLNLFYKGGMPSLILNKIKHSFK
ncbi:MAG TPA: DUF2156 domain-containing protein [Candidatus Atribacteria bacterium]|nr:DUF2156 domain-containing protein [Candidatus Atribacteria bacterium]